MAGQWTGASLPLLCERVISEASSLAASSTSRASMQISASGNLSGVVPFISVTPIGQSCSTVTTDRTKEMALAVEPRSSHVAVNRLCEPSLST
jgi:hypothetical protein